RYQELPPSTFTQREKASGRTQDHNRCALFVFWRGRDLRLVQFERDGVALVVDSTEMKCVPVNNDLAAANTEKATEINHGSAHRSGAINDDVDDVPHVFIGWAADVASEHAMGIARADDGNRRRWHGLLCCLRRIRLRFIGARSCACDNGDEDGQDHEPASSAHALSFLAFRMTG